MAGNRRLSVLNELKSILKQKSSYVSGDLEYSHANYEALVGNPPYNNDNLIAPVDIYPDFMRVSKELAENVSLIYPFKWVISRDNDFKSTELNSAHYTEFYVHSGLSDIFTNAVINGGINYFLWTNAKRSNDTKMKYFYDNQVARQYTLMDNKSIFIQNPAHTSIVSRVNPINTIPVSSRGPYGMSTTLTNKQIANWDRTGPLTIHVTNGRTLQIEENVTTKQTNDYKVFISKTTDSGRIQGKFKRANRMFTAGPKEICTDTYLKIGSYGTEQEAINAVRYLKTDFANFLIGVLTITHNLSKRVFSLIPNVNFATGEIIDKTGIFLNFDNPETLDAQLLKIYGLTIDETQIIEQSIRPWSDKIGTNVYDNS